MSQTKLLIYYGIQVGDRLINFGYLFLSIQMSEVAIVKNIPEMNAILYSVKHMIKITPVKLPADLPMDADPNHCYLSVSLFFRVSFLLTFHLK